VVKAKKASRPSLELERALQDTVVCPTCGQPLGRDLADQVVRIPDVVDAVVVDAVEEPIPPAPSARRPEAPTDEDVKWALSPPLTAEKRDFLRAATQKVAVAQDRFESKEADLAAVEAMWPPRKPAGREES
jgi:hypothetical protein